MGKRSEAEFFFPYVREVHISTQYRQEPRNGLDYEYMQYPYLPAQAHKRKLPVLLPQTCLLTVCGGVRWLIIIKLLSYR
jgi:hypothetical protein